MIPYHRIYRIAPVLLLAAFSGWGGNEAPDISAAAATERKKGDDFGKNRKLFYGVFSPEGRNFVKGCFRAAIF